MFQVMRTRAARATAMASAAALVVAGCGMDEQPDTGPTATVPATGSPDPTASPTATPTETTPPGDDEPVPPESETPLPDEEPTGEEPFPANLEPDTASASDGARLSPTGMRFGVHENFDRVVIDLSGSGSPGWRAEYTDTPTAQGSGREVDLAGEAALALRIEGMVLPTEEAAEPWQGPESLAPQSAGTIEQIRRGPLFEGTQEIFVGLSSAEPFRVYSLPDPARVVIDVYHPEISDGDAPLPDPDPNGEESPFPANREPDVADASEGARLSPVDLRFGVHEGFDRVVLDLQGAGLPGWRGEYVSEPALPGSGAPLDLTGDASLQVGVTGVIYPTAEGGQPYHGPQRFRPRAGGVVEEVVYGSIFEGQVEVYLGLSTDQPFRVFRLEDPARVVIDVQHP